MQSLFPQISHTAYEIAPHEWQENIRKWESISHRFNASMKKALFLDKAPSSVRVLLQKQNLDTFEAMAAATLQFLQHNAQYRAGLTVSRSMPEAEWVPQCACLDPELCMHDHLGVELFITMFFVSVSVGMFFVVFCVFCIV